MFGIEQKVEKAARKGAAFSAATVLALVGLGFLTFAAWIVLVEVQSTLFAATVIGCVYVGAATLIAALGLKKSPQPSVAPNGKTLSEDDLTPLQLVVLSFLQGFEKGRKKEHEPL